MHCLAFRRRSAHSFAQGTVVALDRQQVATIAINLDAILKEGKWVEGVSGLIDWTDVDGYILIGRPGNAAILRRLTIGRW